MPQDPEFEKDVKAFLERERAKVKAQDYSFDPARYPATPTAEELKRLRKERDTPNLVLDLEIGGMVQRQVKTVNAFQREERIAFLHELAPVSIGHLA